MKKNLKTGIFAATVLLGVGLLFSFAREVEHTATGVPPAAQAATAQATGAQTGLSAGQALLKWGVLVYAVGEVAGAIGMGIAHMRTVQRQERATAQAADAKPQLLFYSDYKKKAAPAAGAA